MSQSATLYRVSQDTFAEIFQSQHKGQFNIPSLAKSYSVFQGSFMALEYILSKGQDENTANVISEIFNPNSSMSNEVRAELTMEEYFELFESGDYIQYIDLNTVSKMNEILETVSDSNVDSKYDAKELNDNGIYPGIWHNNNSPGLAYNKSQILEDLTALKTLFKKAHCDKDYILVFVG